MHRFGWILSQKWFIFKGIKYHLLKSICMLLHHSLQYIIIILSSIYRYVVDLMEENCDPKQLTAANFYHDVTVDTIVN